MTAERILGDLLTLNEAQTYLTDGTLPDSFTERVRLGRDFDSCRNCDDRKCMACVMREWDHNCAENQCDFCDQVVRRA